MMDTALVFHVGFLLQNARSAVVMHQEIFVLIAEREGYNA